MSRYKIKKPKFTATELNSNIAYGMTSVNNINQDELDSIQWLCEKSMNDDIKITYLQSKLAEKEKEIEDMKFMMRNTEQALNNVPNAMAGQRKRIDELTKELKQTKQDKISFAVEQLEKTRKLIDELLDNCGDKQYKVWEVFDNQIKQLKEKNNG